MTLVGVSCGERGKDFALRTAYVRALNRAGLAAVILPRQEAGPAEQPVVALDGLLLSGGGDIHPMLCGEEPYVGIGEVDLARDSWEIELVRLAIGRGLPIMGICRGMQLVNVALGGSIWQDLGAYYQANPNVPRICHNQTAAKATPWHMVRLAGNLSEICGKERRVNSFHHQAVRRLGANLAAVARAEDGLTEAIWLNDYPFALGLQWHEEYLAEDGIWQSFAAACRKFAKNKL